MTEAGKAILITIPAFAGRTLAAYREPQHARHGLLRDTRRTHAFHPGTADDAAARVAGTDPDNDDGCDKRNASA